MSKDRFLRPSMLIEGVIPNCGALQPRESLP
jgi:hypothetical protein